MFLFAISRNELHTSRIYATISLSDNDRVCPVISLFLKSSSWFTSISRRCAFLYISMSIDFCDSSFVLFNKSSNGDIINVRGVRSSWLIFVKKRNFIWFISSFLQPLVLFVVNGIFHAHVLKSFYVLITIYILLLRYNMNMPTKITRKEDVPRFPVLQFLYFHIRRCLWLLHLKCIFRG